MKFECILIQITESHTVFIFFSIKGKYFLENSVKFGILIQFLTRIIKERSSSETINYKTENVIHLWENEKCYSISNHLINNACQFNTFMHENSKSDSFSKKKKKLYIKVKVKNIVFTSIKVIIYLQGRFFFTCTSNVIIN